MRDPRLVKKHDLKFQGNYGYLRNEVAKYDVLKKKLNVDNVRGAVVNYDAKKRKFEAELKKKRYINIRKTVSTMDLEQKKLDQFYDEYNTAIAAESILVTPGISRVQSPGPSGGKEVGGRQRLGGVERKSFVNCRVNNKKNFMKNVFSRHNSEV